MLERDLETMFNIFNMHVYVYIYNYIDINIYFAWSGHNASELTPQEAAVMAQEECTPFTLHNFNYF